MKFIRKKYGFALPLVIVLSLVMVTIGMGFLYRSGVERRLIVKRLEVEKAFFLAEAGLERAVSLLKRTSDWESLPTNLYTNVPLGEGTYTVILQDKSQDRVRVVARGRVREAEKELIRVFSRGAYWRQSDWSGGSGQKIWKDPTRWYVGENVETEEYPGELRTAREEVEETFENRGRVIFYEGFEERGRLIFRDGFEDGNIKGWTTGGGEWVPTQEDKYKGVWSIKAGKKASSSPKPPYRYRAGSPYLLSSIFSFWVSWRRRPPEPPWPPKPPSNAFQDAWIKRKIDGPSTIIFWWKAKTLNKSGLLRFLVDDQDKLYISGNTKWEKANFSIPSGSHWIEWRYSRERRRTGEDTGYVDEIKIYSKGIGKGWISGGTDDAYWFLDSSTRKAGRWSARAGALVQRKKKGGGCSSPTLYVKGKKGVSWIKRKVTGPATIRWYWKIEAKAGKSWLDFLVDGYQKFSLTGRTGWREQVYSIPSGSHWIEWKYVKLDESLVGRDTGWIDEIRIYNRGLGEGWRTGGNYKAWWWVDNSQNHTPGGTWSARAGRKPENHTPPPPPPPPPRRPREWILFLFPKNFAYASPYPPVYRGETPPGEKISEWEYKLDEHHYYVKGPGDKWYLVGPPERIEKHSRKKENWDYYKPPEPPRPPKPPPPPPPPKWKFVSWIERTVEGPFTLRFWWKVSSSKRYGVLRFFLDNEEKFAISGIRGWEKKEIEIPEGTHTIGWKYTKSRFWRSRGEDTGWIDDIKPIYFSAGEGWLISSAYDTGGSTEFRRIEWRGSGEVKFQLRTGAFYNELISKPFVGPEGRETTFYTNPNGEDIWSGHKEDRWIQYKVYLGSDGVVQEVVIRYGGGETLTYWRETK